MQPWSKRAMKALTGKKNMETTIHKAPFFTVGCLKHGKIKLNGNEYPELRVSRKAQGSKVPGCPMCKAEGRINVK